MPAYGSRAVYAEPQDGLPEMKQKARSHGHFPKVGQSSEAFLYKKLQQIQRGKEISGTQARRRQLDDRLNYELETERAMMDMRQNRMPGFRGLGARMAGADQAAQQVLNA